MSRVRTPFPAPWCSIIISACTNAVAFAETIGAKSGGQRHAKRPSGNAGKWVAAAVVSSWVQVACPAKDGAFISPCGQCLAHRLPVPRALAMGRLKWSAKASAAADAVLPM